MEILNTTEHIVEFSLFIIIASVLILLFGSVMLVGVSSLIQHKNYREDLAATIVCVIITSVFVLALVMIIDQGVKVTHDVKVSDWNEVYDQGYEVVKQDGEIVTIQLKR